MQICVALKKRMDSSDQHHFTGQSLEQTDHLAQQKKIHDDQAEIVGQITPRQYQKREYDKGDGEEIFGSSSF